MIIEFSFSLPELQNYILSLCYINITVIFKEQLAVIKKEIILFNLT